MHAFIYEDPGLAREGGRLTMLAGIFGPVVDDDELTEARVCEALRRLFDTAQIDARHRACGSSLVEYEPSDVVQRCPRCGEVAEYEIGLYYLDRSSSAS